MRKTIASLVLAASLVLPSAALAEKVGDKMPPANENSYPVASMPWKGEKAEGYMIHSHDQQGCKYNVFFLKCQGKLRDIPFLIYDIREEKAYIDNSPTDGIIDEVLDRKDVEGIPASTWAPDCGESI